MFPRVRGGVKTKLVDAEGAGFRPRGFAHGRARGVADGAGDFADPRTLLVGGVGDADAEAACRGLGQGDGGVAEIEKAGVVEDDRVADENGPRDALARDGNGDAFLEVAQRGGDLEPCRSGGSIGEGDDQLDRVIGGLHERFDPVDEPVGPGGSGGLGNRPDDPGQFDEAAVPFRREAQGGEVPAGMPVELRVDRDAEESSVRSRCLRLAPKSVGSGVESSRIGDGRGLRLRGTGLGELRLRGDDVGAARKDRGTEQDRGNERGGSHDGFEFEFGSEADSSSPAKAVAKRLLNLK